MSKLLFQTIQFRSSTVSMSKQSYFNLVLHKYAISVPKIVLFQSTQLSSTWLIHKNLSGASTLGQSGHGSDGNKDALRIPHSSSIIVTSPSDCLVFYPEHSLGGLTPLQRSNRCIVHPQPTEEYLLYIYMCVCVCLIPQWQNWILVVR